MSSKRKDVSPARTNPDKNIGFTFEDLQSELRRLNDELNPTPAADEFTTSQYADANTMTRDVAHYLLENGVRSGKLTRRTIKATVYYKKV